MVPLNMAGPWSCLLLLLGLLDCGGAHNMVLPTRNVVLPPHTRVVPPYTRLEPPHTRVLPPHTRVLPPHTRLVPPYTMLVLPHTRVVPPYTRVLPPYTRLLPTPESTQAQALDQVEISKTKEVVNKLYVSFNSLHFLGSLVCQTSL